MHVRHVVRGADAASSFALHLHATERTDTAAESVMDDEYGLDVECSLILEGPDKATLECVMAHQDDRRRMWDFLHQRYSVNTTLSQAVLHSTLG